MSTWNRSSENLAKTVTRFEIAGGFVVAEALVGLGVDKGVFIGDEFEVGPATCLELFEVLLCLMFVAAG